MSVLLLALLAAAPTPTLLTLDGDGLTSTAFTRADLDALGPVTIEFQDKKGTHKATGVRLDLLIAKAGFQEGPSGPKVDPAVKHAGLRGAVVASATDGYLAVFSVGELLASLGPTAAYVVWLVDGQPIAADLGPLRLLVPTDKGGSRSLHQLTALHLRALH